MLLVHKVFTCWVDGGADSIFSGSAGPHQRSVYNQSWCKVYSTCWIIFKCMLLVVIAHSMWTLHTTYAQCMLLVVIAYNIWALQSAVTVHAGSHSSRQCMLFSNVHSASWESGIGSLAGWLQLRCRKKVSFMVVITVLFVVCVHAHRNLAGAHNPLKVQAGLLIICTCVQ